MSELSKFTVSKAKPLPVVLLADISGSMGVEGKIDALNQSVREMIATFADEAEQRAEIHVCVVTFGSVANMHLPLQPASEAVWTDMPAGGSTPMGQAMQIAADLIDDKEAIPSRAYRPTVVLVSDGMPTDDWRRPLERMVRDGRAKKAHRMALAIGGDADESMLTEFIGNPEEPLRRAEDARRIKDFFEYVTMSVTQRSRSANPNMVPKVDDPFDLEDF